MKVAVRMVGAFGTFLWIFLYCAPCLGESDKAHLSSEKWLPLLGSENAADPREASNPTGLAELGLEEGSSRGFSWITESGEQESAHEARLRIAEVEENEEALPDEWDDSSELWLPQESISDPIEPINRAFFQFNDKLYFWFLKPIARGYGAVFPEPVRIAVRNFFYNTSFPIRFVNCVFQGKFRGAGIELSRFLFNSTIGVGGFFDPATRNLQLDRQEEDLGQTFGFYDMGPGFFITWPVLGPSSMRDTVGMVGDAFLDPFNYIDETKYVVAVKGYKVINDTSLTIGDYEELKRAALDPYVAVRDAYYQYRQSKIEE
jgi:phospholipid-binding lipoprotein MlaA